MKQNELESEFNGYRCWANKSENGNYYVAFAYKIGKQRAFITTDKNINIAMTKLCEDIENNKEKK